MSSGYHVEEEGGSSERSGRGMKNWDSGTKKESPARGSDFALPNLNHLPAHVCRPTHRREND